MADAIKVLVVERNGTELPFYEEQNLTAAIVPFSDSGFASTDVSGALIELSGLLLTTAHPYNFNRQGSTGTGTYLQSAVGSPVVGNAVIRAISVSNTNSLAAITRFQVRRRTAISTYVDITNAYVDVPASNYRATRTGLAIPIGPDWELAVLVLSGSTAANPNVVIYISAT